MTAELRNPAQAERPLTWIGEVLGWTFASDGAADGRRYWALPSREHARILVPSGAPARGALSIYTDSMTQPARFKKAALGRYLSLGPGWAPGADRVLVRAPGPQSDDDTLERFIEGVVGTPVDLGVAIGPALRPNRKPVLQVVDRRGRIVAFAKIGWNDHTRALIAAEAAALTHLAGCSLSFAIPRLIHHGTWQERGVLIVSPGPTSVIRRSHRNQPPPLRAELDVARSGHGDERPLASSPYMTDLVARIKAPLVTRSTADGLLAAAERLMARDGDRATPFGAWHGDWAPWNMIRSRQGLFVMDWERYGGPVPVGFDHLHLRFQLVHQVGKRPVTEAGERAIEALGAAAGSLGLDPSGASTLFALYLIERALRVEVGSSAGMATTDTLVPAVLRFLEGAAR